MIQILIRKMIILYILNFTSKMYYFYSRILIQVRLQAQMEFMVWSLKIVHNLYQTGKLLCLIFILWRNSSGGRAAGLIYTYRQLPEVTGSIPGVSHKFRIVRIIIPACLIKQPNGTLSRMYVLTYMIYQG